MQKLKITRAENSDIEFELTSFIDTGSALVNTGVALSNLNPQSDSELEDDKISLKELSWQWDRGLFLLKHGPLPVLSFGILTQASIMTNRYPEYHSSSSILRTIFRNLILVQQHYIQ